MERPIPLISFTNHAVSLHRPPSRGIPQDILIACSQCMDEIVRVHKIDRDAIQQSMRDGAPEAWDWGGLNGMSRRLASSSQHRELLSLFVDRLCVAITSR